MLGCKMSARGAGSSQENMDGTVRCAVASFLLVSTRGHTTNARPPVFRSSRMSLYTCDSARRCHICMLSDLTWQSSQRLKA